MGCAASKLEEEEAVRLCRERRNSIKQALDERSRFAAGHVAYIQSLRQVSDALRAYLGDTAKRLSSPETAAPAVRCLRAGGAPAAVTAEEAAPSPETGAVSEHEVGADGFIFFSPAMDWDFFWSRFAGDEDLAVLRRIREAEGIPELEEEELPASKPESPAMDLPCELPSEEKTPGYTVYLNRRPASLAQAMEDIETQFAIMHESARELASVLESDGWQQPRLTKSRALMANPTAVVLPASPGSSSSSDGQHRTLERLYAWEKKLYEEVKAGERIRAGYERRCAQLRKQSEEGEEPSKAEKTRAAARELQARLKVSVHSVEAISARIDRLRDEELFPQLAELVRGMERMWGTMAECHREQQAVIDGAKQLLARGGGGVGGPAEGLEAELRSWRRRLKIWDEAQRGYLRCLSAWAILCGGAPPETAEGRPAVFGLCAQWRRTLEGVSAERALEGLDMFAAGISAVAAQRREAAAAEEEDAAAKTAELAARVLFAGMSVAVSALAEFAAASRDGYGELLQSHCPKEDPGR
ncbi:uncharacterized protein LOC144705433 [Wolffia australiana]